MDVDWARFALQVLILVVIYHMLVAFSPLPRLSRERQFLVFGGIGAVVLFVFALVYPVSGG
ncbi:MAG: hypothetical protein AAF376_00880 [Pseudomonadota bacterium]